jgi:hypothetical protein
MSNQPETSPAEEQLDRELRKSLLAALLEWPRYLTTQDINGQDD